MNETEKHKGRAQLTEGERSIGISATVTASDKARLKELGNGNLSAGIRVAVERCQTAGQKDATNA